MSYYTKTQKLKFAPDDLISCISCGRRCRRAMTGSTFWITRLSLVVLGITLERFRRNKCKMRHQDMEVLAIDITEKATAASVTEVLCRIAKTTGLPAQILSDGGHSIKRGITDFIDGSGSAIRQTYDVTHKTALTLERHLKDDGNWKRFIDLACETKRSLIHAAIGFIAPPKPRDKADGQTLMTILNVRKI